MSWLVDECRGIKRSRARYNGNYTPLSQAGRWHGLRSDQAPQKVRSRMHWENERSVLKPGVRYANSRFKVTRGAGSTHEGVLCLEGALRMPLNGEVPQNVTALLRHGARLIVLDLSGVPKIDAAGVGELVRAFNLATAAGGKLRVVGATTWVREILERVGLFGILSEGGSPSVTSLAR